jgi:hypothetical protein
VKRIKHNDLTHYFLRPHSELPQAYLASCEKFFKELSNKRQASSSKRQAPAGQPEVEKKIKKDLTPTKSLI